MSTSDFDPPEWRIKIEAALAAAANPHTTKYCQLASVCSEFGAQVRTVVFRGFDPQSPPDRPRIWIATEAASAKVVQFRHQPKAQLAWYFVDTREQFRLSVTVDMIAADAVDQTARYGLWKSMSSAARTSFLDTVGMPSNEQNLQTPPGNFMLLALDVVEVDHLQIARLPHQRVRYSFDQDLDAKSKRGRQWRNEAIAL